MKELSIEQKAKAYDEAIERARYWEKNPTVWSSDDICQKLFPELKENKESEDEKIRKELIKIVKVNIPNEERYIAWLEKQGEHANFLNKIQIGDRVTRNEAGILVNISQLNRVAKKRKKQGEQKPADKIEQKFKVGDWVVFNNKHQSIYQVEKVEDGYYILRHTHGGTFRVCVLHDENLRLWTIEDARDGDVLGWDDSKCITLFKNIFNKDSFNSHGYVGNLTGIFKSGLHYHDIEGAHPATKEQRDTLFAKMREAGYEWDTEKKELKKIDTYCQDNCNGF